MEIYITVSIGRTPPHGSARWTQTARLSDLIWLGSVCWLMMRAQGMV